MTKAQVHNALYKVVEQYDSLFDPGCFMLGMKDYDELSDLKDTSLQPFVNEITTILEKQRHDRYVFNLAGLSSTCDGQSIEAYFAIAWLEPDNTLMMMTIKMYSA